MKNRQTHLRLALLTAGLASASAANLTWDIAPDPGIQGGTGTWDTSSARWTSDDGTSNVAWSGSSNTALFAAGSGIATVSGDIDLAGLTVSSPTGSSIGGRNNVGYLFNGGTLRFGAQNGVIDTTAALTTLQINGNLTGTGGLTLHSTGADTGDNPWTVLNGNNSGLSGGITVTSGLLAVTSQQAAGSNAITLQNGGGLFGPVTHSGDGSGAAIVPANDLALTNALHVTGTENRIRVWGGRSLSLSGALTGSGSVRKADAGTLNLTGSLSGFTGEIVNSAGITNLGSAYSGTLAVQAGSANLNAPFSGTLVLTGGAVVSNAGFTGTVDFTGGNLTVASGTFASNIAYNGGSLTIAAGATVDGNVSANFGATSLTVAGIIDGNLLLDEQIATTFSGGSITGNLTTGDPLFNPLITLNQTNGPIQIGGTLTVNGDLDLVADGSVPQGQNLVTYAHLVTTSPNPADDVRVVGVDLMRNGVTTIGATGISFSSTPGTVTWTGAQTADWSAAAEQNWTLGGNPDSFYNGDSVVFPADATATAVALSGSVSVSGMSVATDTGYTFTRSGIGGTGEFTKTGFGSVTFNQSAGNSFPGGFSVSEGSVVIGSNQQATGSGPLTLASGTTLTSFAAVDNATLTMANSAISVSGASWTFGGSSAGTATHTYNFSGAAGSTTATDPATAIQISDSTLSFSSTNSTAKAFNGRIRWSGSNTINRTTGNFTHSTSWNRAWYGDGSVFVNMTGTATGRSMTFAGAGSTFSGVLSLNSTEASGGDNPTFVLNQPLPAAVIEVANRWHLNNNVAGGLDGVGQLMLFGTAAKVTLTQPVNNAGLDVDLGPGTLVMGNAASTIGTITGDGATLQSGGASSALTVTESSGSAFAGTLDLEAGNTLSVTADSVGIGTQDIGSLVQSAGNLKVGFDASGTNIAGITGAYTCTGGNLIVDITSLPATGTPYTVLTFGSRTGTPPVVITGLEGSSLEATVGYQANAITLTFSGTSANLTWTGAIDGNWDTLTENWSAAGSPSAYTQFDTTTFNDDATLTDVLLEAVVTPGGVTFSHSAKNYSVTGFGAISGGTSLAKSGTGTLTLVTANTYTGGTTLTGGRVRVGANTALGTGSVSINNATLSSDSTTARSLANAVTLAGTATFGDATDTGTVTLTGPVSGAGNLIKANGGTLILSPAAANSITGSIAVSGGALSVGTNQQATGTGALFVTTGGTFNSFGLTSTATFTLGNPTLSINGGTWSMGGSSGGSVTHTYNFAGDLGSTTATDPSTAIQVTNGTITFNSSNSTTKAFNGRVNWSGSNTINRTSGAFTHGTNWNRPWYGTGTITINKTGTASGRSMTFAGAGSTFNGTLVLNNTQAGAGNDPAFNLNQPLPAATIEVRNRWNLNHNVADGFAANATVTVFDATARLTLTQPVNRPALALAIGSGMVNLAGTASTVGTLTVNGVAQPAGVYDSTTSPAFLTGTGTLTVVSGGTGGGYNAWLTSFGLVPGNPGTGANESADGSGVANMVQFVLGGDPTDSADNGIHRVFRTDSLGVKELVLTIAVPSGTTFTGSPSPASTISGLNCAVQGGTSLGAWTNTVEEIAVQNGGGTVVAPDGYVLKSFRLVQTPALGSKGFLRVTVSQP